MPPDEATPTRIFYARLSGEPARRLDFGGFRAITSLASVNMLCLAAVAAKSTVWEKVQAVPLSTWIALVIGAVVLVALVRIWKSLREFNEFAPWIALIMVGGSVVLYWTYERTEPKVLSPVINFLSQYLPSKIPYQGGTTPEKPAKKTK